MAAMAAVCLVLGLLCAFSLPGDKADGLFFDRLAPLLGSTQNAPDYLVILIKERDYQKASRPLALWGELLAPLIDKIARARPKALGIDLILPQFPLLKVSPRHDPILLKALADAARKTRLISGYALLPSGKAREPMPLYRRILGQKGYGYFNLSPDRDGVNRSLLLSRPGAKGQRLTSFAARMAGIDPQPGREATPDWRNPHRFSRMDFQAALVASADSFKGKTVLIGLDLPFLDRHPTPVKPQGEPGVVVQARFCRALGSGQTLLRPDWLTCRLAPALFGLALFWLLGRTASPRRLILAWAASLAALLILVLAALAWGLILFPLAGAVSVTAFFLWRFQQSQAIIRRLFGRYVSREVRRQLQAGELPLDGELREATMLFSDLRDFTAMCEQEPPREVVRLVNDYFERMSRIIRRHGGQVLLYAGDEIFAFFGAPFSRGNHADLALAAALEMRAGLAKLNRLSREQGRPLLRHGVGIHTGQVVAGNLGSRDRATYSLMGDAVNLASRLQGLTKQLGGDILLSQATRELISSETKLEELPPTAVKGKELPVKVWRVI